MTAPAPTFRDFASQVFAGDLAAAQATLVVLLGLPEDEARRATEHFKGKTSDPAFLPLAMSLRTAVAGTDDGVIAALLVTCFGLDEDAARTATAALRARYLALTAIERRCLAHLHAQIEDPVLRHKLTPDYAFFCKRPSFSNELYPSLSRPNVELVTDSIERVTERGIVTKDGRERALDVLVLATGFLVTERANMPAFETLGRGGLSLGAFWDEHRLQAYEGASVPRFPNHFMMVGPYSVTGASWFSIAEAQSRHVLRCVREAKRRNASRVEVREDAHRRYFDDMQRRMPNTLLFTQDCTRANSYYYDRHGDSPLIRPASGLEQWWRSGHFDLDDYAYS